MAFAIPSDTVQYVISQLMHFGRVRRPWLGATLTSLPNSRQGMLVVSVVPGSPAANAGLSPGDLVIALNGHPVHRIRDVVEILEHSAIGRHIRVNVLRGNAKLILTMVLKEQPTQSIKKSAS